MRNLIPSLVLLMGVILACVGIWWVWTGLDIVQVERGWTAVIAGATMLSGGLVITALAGVLARLRDIADALGGEMAIAPASRVDETRGLANGVQDADRLEAGATLQEPTLPDGRQVVGRHVSGEATYVMFADGTVEAQSPEGSMTFPSLDALRSYADEREADNARSGAERS